MDLVPGYGDQNNSDFRAHRLMRILSGQESTFTSIKIAEIIDDAKSTGLLPLIATQILKSGEALAAADLELLNATLRQEIKAEMLRQVEVSRVLGALLKSGYPAVLCKGTALAYGLYPWPASRPRGDTDLLIADKSLDLLPQVFEMLNYKQAPSTAVTRQWTFFRTDEFGLDHSFDIHWRISNRARYENAITFSEARATAQALPIMGSAAWAMSPELALLHACIHLMGHHAGSRRLIWFYDIVLLLRNFSENQLEDFLHAMEQKNVAKECAVAISMTERLFGPLMHARRLKQMWPELETIGYPRETGLEKTFWDDLGFLSWGGRLTFLARTLFPNKNYMYERYGLTSPYAILSLPLLYFFRITKGCQMHFWRAIWPSADYASGTPTISQPKK